jgi:hypothetical protein
MNAEANVAPENQAEADCCHVEAPKGHLDPYTEQKGSRRTNHTFAIPPMRAPQHS